MSQRSFRLRILGFLCLVPGLAADAKAQTLTKIVPDAAERGTVVRIEGDKIPTMATRPIVRLVPVGTQESCAVEPPNRPDVPALLEGSTVVFTVPALTPIGRYQICVLLNDPAATLAPPAGARPFRVRGSPVTISAITPPAVYTAKDSPYTFWIDGSGFSPVPEENVLLIDGHATRATVVISAAPPQVAEGNDPQPTTKPPAPLRPAAAGNVSILEPRQLHVTLEKFDDQVWGKRNIQIRVDDQVSPVRQLLVSSEGRGTSRGLAFLGVLVILIILFLLIRAGLRRIAINRPSVFAALLLENGAYSLGKLQFYAWTVAALFGYLFLAFARAFVQGIRDMPDVPEGLPAIVGISAGTGVAAAAIGAISGTKGPAGTKPSMADLIMTGGSVVADRVQFLTWTFVSIVVFLAIVVAFDPATVDTLPRIPDGLLWLMGLSAGGYLGGKFVRRPAPSITEVAAGSATETSVKLTIKGRQLSKDVSLVVNDKPVATPGSGANVLHDGITATSSEQGSSELFQQIETTIRYPEGFLKLDADNTLTLMNPDGQAAKGIIRLKAPVDAAAQNLVPAAPSQEVWQRPLRSL